MALRHRGFTLLELMVVVTIVGVLSTVAIPTMVKLQYRSKQAERKLITTSIERAVDDYYARDFKYPVDLGGGTSTVTLPVNPAYPPQAYKRPFVLGAVGDWQSLALSVEGGLYFCYSGVGIAVPPPGIRQYSTTATGDIDGDGDWAIGLGCTATHTRQWVGVQIVTDTWVDAALQPGPLYGCF